MSEIEVPCGFCGQEAKTSTGIHYIGKSPWDPEQKPACIKCVLQLNEIKKNKTIKYEKNQVGGLCTCLECFALIHPHEDNLKGHAKQAHQCDKWEIINP